MNSLTSKNRSSAFTVDTETSSTTFNQISFQNESLSNQFNLKNDFRFLMEINQEDQEPNPYTHRFKIDLRERYLCKLLGSEEKQNLPSLKHQNIFIFDWDDTLLCTSYLSQKRFTQISEEAKKMIKQLDQLSYNNLKFATQKGPVFIITNSAKGWVSYSSKIYMPKTHSLFLSSQKIKVWSARQFFQQKYPDSLAKWKVETFKKIKQYCDTYLLTNMICIGDSEEQMIASHLLSKDFKRIYLKTIKLQQKPNPEQLIKQLKVLEKRFEDIFSAVTSTTIKLAKRVLSPQKSKRTTQKVNNKNGQF